MVPAVPLSILERGGLEVKPELQGPLGTNEPQNTGIKTMGRGSLPRGVVSPSPTAQNLGLVELKKPWDSLTVVNN